MSHYELIELMRGPAVPILSKALRSMLVAQPGRKFCGGDFANVEGRINAWLAGEQWKLDAFRAYDEGRGPDLYNLAYAGAFGVSAREVNKTQRQVGKVMELSCIAEGELVWTDKGHIPIQDVKKDQCVWDGYEFVQHDGVVDRGCRPVIKWAGLSATLDHDIFLNDQMVLPFGRCAAMGLRPFWNLGNRYNQNVYNNSISETPVVMSDARTYDILNCGRRNRFSVNGWLVHNCGYQGSVGAYMNMAANYFIKPDDIVRTVKPQTYGTDVWRVAAEQYDKATNRYGLSADQWICLKIVVNGWRTAHPAIVQSWWDRQDGVVEAVGNPGTVVSVLGGKISYIMHEGFLWMRTPSRKLMAYARPRLVETREDYIVDAEGEIWPIEEMTVDEMATLVGEGGSVQRGKTRTQVAFDGKNQRTGAWGTHRMYGGLLTNNDTQLTARELLRFAMENVEAAGYPVVLHVHDELVAEVDQAFGSAHEFGEIMKILPPWIKGLPMAVSAWEDQRFG